jgi:hypothetical protein
MQAAQRGADRAQKLPVAACTNKTVNLNSRAQLVAMDSFGTDDS